MTNIDINVASIVGARPNFIKLAPIYRRLKEGVNHIIIHTGQHYDFEMSSIFFKEFDLPQPDYNLEVGSGPPASQTAEMIKGVEQILIANNFNFDVVLVYGDTNSTFAGAFAAAKSNIKVAHVEAGLRSFDRRMPEEINRLLTDNISDYLFAPTKTSVNNLINEHIRGQVYDTGDISVEIINEAIKLSQKNNILNELNLEPKDYILFTMHRAENTKSDVTFSTILRVFEKVSSKIIFPIHPRTKNILHKNNLLSKFQRLENLRLISPLGYIDFITLIQNAQKVVTDSGGIQKESYLLNVPCVTIRENTEWVETIEEGMNRLVGTDASSIVNAIEKWNPRYNARKKIFGSGYTSSTIKDILLNELS